jgi:glycosyltransferase involved in cell wall biosynthesis
MPDKRLIIVGSYEKAHHFTEYAKRMQDMAPSNVEFRSWVTDEELRELYGGCIGFVTTARDEDFGMTVVEAMAAGKPVLAPNEGGYRETVVDGQTGILIDDIDADTLRTAIHELEKKAVNMRGACEERAREFDSDIFTETMRKEIMQCINSQ